MRLREMSGQTLGDVSEQLHEENNRQWGGVTYEIGIDLQDDDPYFTLNNHDVPATPTGLEQLARFAEIPPKFLMRLDKDEQEWLLKSRLERLAKPDTVVYWNDFGIQEVRPANEIRLDVADLVDQIMAKMPVASVVDSWWNTPEEFRLDVVVPEDYTKGVGGEVGDITRGGVRVGQNRKANLAPFVQPYLLRLVCTNGLEVPDSGIKVEARKLSEDEILSYFRHEVGRAFDRVEGDIRSFYDLKQTRFSDSQRAMDKIAREAGLPERTVRELAASFPEDDQTMFDVINHITEYANGISNRASSSYRNLQIAGGSKVYDHSQRCENCLSRI